MSRFRSLVAFLLILIGSLFWMAAAQPAPEEGLGQIVGDAITLVGQFKALGLLAFILGVAGLLTRATKIPLIAGWLGKAGKNVRPWVSAGLGALTGVLTALAAGKGVAETIFAALAGLGSGLAMTGLDQGISRAAAPTEHRIADTVRALIADDTKKASDTLLAFGSQMTAAAKLPPAERARLLDEWLTAHPASP